MSRIKEVFVISCISVSQTLKGCCSGCIAVVCRPNESDEIFDQLQRIDDTSFGDVNAKTLLFKGLPGHQQDHPCSMEGR